MMKMQIAATKGKTKQYFFGDSGYSRIFDSV